MTSLKVTLDTVLSGPDAKKVGSILPEVKDKLELLVTLIEKEAENKPLAEKEIALRIDDYLTGLREGYKFSPQVSRTEYYQEGFKFGTQLKTQYQGGNKRAYNIHLQLVYMLRIFSSEVMKPREEDTQKGNANRAPTRSIYFLKEKVRNNGNSSHRASYGLLALMDDYRAFLQSHLTSNPRAATTANMATPSSIVDSHVEQGLLDLISGGHQEGTVYEFTQAFMAILEHKVHLDNAKYTRVLRSIGLINFGNDAKALRPAYLELMGTA